MERHAQAVDAIAATVRNFFEHGESYRVSHGSSNSTRPGHGATRQSVVDISKLSNVLTINNQNQTALVEPNVPMDRLVEATLEHGLVPPVVMEFPGITVGGGFSGTSGESSSFRHGFFDNTVNSVEMVLGNGEVVIASREEHSDLFHGAAGAAGTLGIVTLLELKLVKAKKLVKTTYHKVQTVSEAIQEIQSQMAPSPQGPDYIDGIVFSPQHSVIITGELTDELPAGCRLQTFSNAGDPWFYMHVNDITRDHSPLDPDPVEYIPLGEYLFRYDRAGFWVGRQGYTYFKVIPFTKFFRWLLDDYSHTRTLYHALHAGGIAEKFVVQDLALPFNTAEEFINWVDQELGIWPLWLCPLKGGCSLPTFHPVTASRSTLEGKAADNLIQKMAENPVEIIAQNPLSQPMLNVGVWGWGPQDYETFVRKNRALEKTLARLGGRKWLYAHTYYTEEEFWDEYNHQSEYNELRKKYFATTLPTVYDKVKPRPRQGMKKDDNSTPTLVWMNPLALGKWVSNVDWLRTWPIGGIYGMIKATLSGDIGLHRQAKWRYKED